MNTQETTQATEVRQGWRDENGNVDLDAVRAGNVDVADRDAVLAALLAEVEQLRGQSGYLAEQVDHSQKGWWLSVDAHVKTRNEVEQLRAELEAARETIRGLDTQVSDLTTKNQQDRALMRAVLDTIDVPSPAAYGGKDTYLRLIDDRAASVKMALVDTLSGKFSQHDVPVMVKFLRRQIESYPVTYEVEGGESR